ncbi:MAG: hypothetical protein JKY94_13660 [Rhodobacteraceae bacterium]|nr:hypothetical protein [Paracoccaceae bacterium]
MSKWDEFLTQGWISFAYDSELAKWATHALRASQKAIVDPANAHWHQCEGSWFVGVDVLDNDPVGRVAGSQPLTGPAITFIATHIGAMPPLHRAQVSVISPGYPRLRAGESDAAFGYRQNRDAAHVDGLLAVGPERRRKIREPHSFILGLPLTKASADAAPLVVWQGSHHIMRAAFISVLADHDPATWSDIDITDAYTTARRLIFETCPRVLLPANPGETTLLHRLTLHGVAPWGDTATADKDGRMIAYFRPKMTNVNDWLAAN